MTTQCSDFVTDITTRKNNIKIQYEALSTYLISNYLLKDTYSRNNFYDDIQMLFYFYCQKIVSEYLSNLNLNEIANNYFVNSNIKLVYKGPNATNEKISQCADRFESYGVNVEQFSLTSFDFDVVINYQVILHGLKLEFNDLNILELTKLSELIIINILRDFYNNIFSYNNSIYKKTIMFDGLFGPEYKSYELGSNLDQTQIQELFTYANNFFNQIPQERIENTSAYIRQNIMQINDNKSIENNLELLFNVIRGSENQLNLIGFSLPTTFNKHKIVFPDLANINEGNSMILIDCFNSIVNSFIVPFNQTSQTNQSNQSNQSIPQFPTNLTYNNKIQLEPRLENLEKRFDKIKTRFYEKYPSPNLSLFCKFSPTKIAEMLNNQISGLNGLIISGTKSLHNFYATSEDKLTMYEDIEYKDYNKNVAPGYTGFGYVCEKTILSSYENMCIISVNYSSLFGKKSSSINQWEKINNFNLSSLKIPVRYYFSLTHPIKIAGKQILYLFFDYDGELVNFTTPLYGDSDLRNHLMLQKEESFALNNPNPNEPNYVSYRKDFDDSDEYKTWLDDKFSEIMFYNETRPVKMLSYNTKSVLNNLLDNFFEPNEPNQAYPWEIPNYQKQLTNIIKLVLVYLMEFFDYDQRIGFFNAFYEMIEKVELNFNNLTSPNLNGFFLDFFDLVLKNFIFKIIDVLANVLEKQTSSTYQQHRDGAIGFLTTLKHLLKYPETGTKVNIENLKCVQVLSHD